jgi:hypothetical protein
MPGRAPAGCREAPDDVGAYRNIPPRIGLRQIESEPLCWQYIGKVPILIAAGGNG